MRAEFDESYIVIYIMHYVDAPDTCIRGPPLGLKVRSKERRKRWVNSGTELWFRYC